MKATSYDRGSLRISPDDFRNLAPLGKKDHDVLSLLHVDAQEGVCQQRQSIESGAHVDRCNNKSDFAIGKIELHTILTRPMFAMRTARLSGSALVKSSVVPPGNISLTGCREGASCRVRSAYLRSICSTASSDSSATRRLLPTVVVLTGLPTMGAGFTGAGRFGASS